MVWTRTEDVKNTLQRLQITYRPPKDISSEALNILDDCLHHENQDYFMYKKYLHPNIIQDQSSL